MKKRLLIIALTVTLMLGVAPMMPYEFSVAQAASSGEIIKGVNFRTQPATSSSRIRMLQRGEQVDILEQVNSYWYKVRDKNGRVGYVSTQSQYIKVSTQSNSVATIVSSVSFRTGASTNNSRIRYLQKGEQVTVLSQVNQYWYKVRDKNGRVGYVSTNSKYISVSGQANSSNQATIVAGVNFRTGPSTSNSRIRYLQKGEQVTILSQVNQYWYEVRDKNGRVGYVSTNSKYISTSYSGGTSPGSGSGNNSGSSQSATINKVISSGRSYLGTPYEFGSNRSSTRTFDCSAFVRRAFIEGAGITLPTDSRKQADYVKNKNSTTTNWKNLKRGDLMFFMDYRGTAKSNYSHLDKSKQRISHVGIYLGNGQILHTYSKESGGVRVDNIANRHWEYRFVFGGSAL